MTAVHADGGVADSLQSRVVALYTQPKTPVRDGAATAVSPAADAGAPRMGGGRGMASADAAEYESVIQSLKDILRQKDVRATSAAAAPSANLTADTGLQAQLRQVKKDHEALVQQNQEMAERETHFKMNSVERQDVRLCCRSA
jgi:hypothetical protein